MTRALTAFFLLALTLPAFAADSAKGGVPGTNVDMPFLMAPMTGENLAMAPQRR